MNVVLIPVFNRPEFLTLTLEQIQTNPDAAENLYLFALDFGFKRQNLEVINRFRRSGFQVQLYKTPRTGFSLGKQSYNVLRGYQKAVELSDNLVFMVEDDIFVSNDFFRWHKAVHQRESEIFCTIATRNNNSTYKTTDSLQFYYKTHLDYQSLGVCFRVGRLGLVLKHNVQEYYQDPVGYLSRNYPKSKIGKYYAEQDGLIRRVQESTPEYPIAFPHRARAYHAGFYGVNRGARIEGTLPQKIEKLRNICFDVTSMRRVAANPAYFEDSIPVDLHNRWIEPVELAAEKVIF